jgi:cell division protein FtsW
LRHFSRVVLGLIALIFTAVFLDYKKLRDYAFYVFVVTLVFLILVLIFGRGSAKRWLYIGPVSFQVSEFAKLGMLIYLAYLLEKNREKLTSFKFGFLPLFSVVAVVTLLVLMQKSFTMAFLIFTLGIILIFLGGARMKHLIFGVGLGAVGMVLAIMLEPYRFQRILARFNPEAVGGEVRYQAVQSLIGLGNGGLFGVGLGHSKQRELFLPLAYDDYIFSIWGEELGFIGSVLLILAFILILYSGFEISKYASDDFAKFLASGITLMIFITAFIHIAVVLDIFPSTGIPLPFISYGGSAMVANCIGVGILLNISKQINMLK